MLIPVASVTGGIDRTGTDSVRAAKTVASTRLTADARQLLALLSSPHAEAFAEAPVPSAVLAAILATARQITPLAGHREPAVYVALTDPSGVYKTSASGALADRIAGGDVPRKLHQSYVPAPALLLICDAVSSEHQGALMSAAALGYSAWLAARQRGLDGRLFPDASALVTALARADENDGRRHLFTVALGQPREPRSKQ